MNELEIDEFELVPPASESMLPASTARLRHALWHSAPDDLVIVQAADLLAVLTALETQ
jgi:hypothetical protein